jgi:membrane associated rhomboid family serine protease
VKLRPRATLALTAVTAAAFLIITVGGWSEQASASLGFIPLRLHVTVPWSAVPIWLTPLSATLVHAGFLHLAMNLLVLAFCGREVEKILGSRRSPFSTSWALMRPRPGNMSLIPCQHIRWSALRGRSAPSSVPLR